MNTRTIKPTDHDPQCAMHGRTYSEYQKMIADVIDQSGFMVQGVGAGGSTPTFSYTIGLWPKYGFELLVFGINMKFAAHIFNRIYAEVLLQGETLALETNDDRWLEKLSVRFHKSGQRAHEFVVQADVFYDTRVEVVQLVLPDENNRFPGEPGFNAAYMNRCQLLTYDDSPKVP